VAVRRAVVRGRVEAVLFDFGNTLFGHAPLADTVARAAALVGIELDAGRCARLAEDIDGAAMHPDELAHGRDLDATVWRDRWQILYGRADATAAGLGATIDRLMHDPREWQPFASTAGTLRALHAVGVRVGVVSNTGWDIRTVFARHGLDGCVDTFVLSYEAGVVKPDPAIFLLAAGRLGATPAATVMVGDDPHADSGAVRAGIRTVLVPLVDFGAENGLDLIVRLTSAPVPTGPG
jgi:HAD superfamily hydrolase (TIGR01509 family)